MNLQLTVQDAHLSEDRLHALSQELCQTLSRQTDIKARLEQSVSQPGSKGDPVTLGVLALTFLTSGSAVALVEVLKARVMRNATLEIEVKNGDKSVKINAQNVQGQQVEQLLASIQQLMNA